MKSKKISTKKGCLLGTAFFVYFVLLFEVSNSVLLCFCLYLGSELLKVGDT